MWCQIPNYYPTQQFIGFSKIDIKYVNIELKFDATYKEISISLSVISNYIDKIRGLLDPLDPNTSTEYKLKQITLGALNTIDTNIAQGLVSAKRGKAILQTLNSPLGNDESTECSINVPFMDEQLFVHAESNIIYLKNIVHITSTLNTKDNAIQDDKKLTATVAVNALSTLVSYTHILNIAIIEYVSILRGITRLGPISEIYFKRGKLLKLSECITEATSIYETRGCKRTGDGVSCNLRISQYLNPLQLTKYVSIAYNGCRLENTYIIGNNFKLYKETAINGKIFTEISQDKCLGGLLSKSETDIKNSCKLSREDVNSYEITSMGIILQKWDSSVSSGINKLTSTTYSERDLPILIENSFELNLGDLSFKYNNKKEITITTLTNSLSNNSFCPNDSFKTIALNLFEDFIRPYQIQLYVAMASVALLIVLITIGPTLVKKAKQLFTDRLIIRQLTPHRANDAPRCCTQNRNRLAPNLEENLSSELATPQELAYHALRSLISQYPRDVVRPYNPTQASII